ncbi:hypothetical protein Aph02nite_46960 [Actinoplanes philippinensis]|nr:hypothetical protein Aph02nite_46960 [Actinoplanes philippinensis]
MSAITRPRPAITTRPAQSCSSLIRWLDTSTARPCSAIDRRKPRIQMMPSGSMPLNGSSSISDGGSPSSAAAMPSRCRMPSENPPAARRATCRNPACSSTASTRAAPSPCECAIHSRWLRAVRLGWSAPASSSDPRWHSGRRNDRYGRPPTSAAPASGRSSPRITRMVVDLPAPFGPMNPVTCPARTANDIPSSACADPKRLRTRSTTIVASLMIRSSTLRRKNCAESVVENERCQHGDSAAPRVSLSSVPGRAGHPGIPRTAENRR